MDAADSGISCKLAVPVQELIKLIFDVKLMKQVMLEFEVSRQPSILTLISILMIINWRRENVAHSTFFTKIEGKILKRL